MATRPGAASAICRIARARPSICGCRAMNPAWSVNCGTTAITCRSGLACSASVNTSPTWLPQRYWSST